MLSLLSQRRFGPLFVTQFLGAFNDNLFKTAMLFLITYHMAGDLRTASVMVAAAGGVFILPFFLFSGIAGQLADAVDKAAIARAVKLAEIGILGVGAIAIALASVPMLFAVLFAMGAHSTIFGPVKYAFLPQHLRSDELLGGTGLVEGGTFVAILLGQVSGGLLSSFAVDAAMLTVAVAGWLSSRMIPAAPPEVVRPIDWNPVTASRTVLARALTVRPVVIVTLAISWFWALGAIFTSQFVPLVKGTLHASETVATLFLVVFTMGIAAGSAGVSRLLRGRVSTQAAPWAAVAMAAASIDLIFAVQPVASTASETVGLASFIATPAAWRLLGDLFVLAAAGGVFSVPLYAILQTRGRAATRSSTVAANNIVNAAFQVAGVLLAGSAIARGMSIPLVLTISGASALLMIPLLRKI
ncbi:MAG: MFS transporter [Janthinobacterium lividum]